MRRLGGGAERMNHDWIRETDRRSFDRLLAQDYNAIIVLSVRHGRHDRLESQQALRQAGASSTTESKLPSRNGLRFARSQALSTVVRNGAVNNGTAIDTFPCIKHEKKIREPFQHHHPFALRTFHWSLPRWLRSQLLATLSKSRANLSYISISTI